MLLSTSSAEKNAMVVAECSDLSPTTLSLHHWKHLAAVAVAVLVGEIVCSQLQCRQPHLHRNLDEW